MLIFQPFEELQGSYSEPRLNTPKPITRTYFDTNLSRFGLAGLTMVVTLDYQIFIFKWYEELQGSNSEFKLIIP